MASAQGTSSASQGVRDPGAASQVPPEPTAQHADPRAAPQGQANDPRGDPQTDPAVSNRGLKIALYVMMAISIALHLIWLIILILWTSGVAISYLDNETPSLKSWQTATRIVVVILMIVFDSIGYIVLYYEDYTSMLSYTISAYGEMVTSLICMPTIADYVSAAIYLNIGVLMTVLICPLNRSRNQVAGSSQGGAGGGGV